MSARNGFKTFIVSGGGIEFMRPWAEKTYGIPPEQVVGSSVRTRFEMRDGKPVLVRLSRNIRASISTRTSALARATEYLDKMIKEPFESFTFSPAGAAIYQLGPYGTAAKQLKEWDLKR